MQTAFQAAELQIRQNAHADRKAAARRVLADMEANRAAWLVNDFVPGIALVEPVHPLRRPRRPLPLSALTIEAARGGLRHLRYTGEYPVPLVAEARQAIQLAAVVYAYRHQCDCDAHCAYRWQRDRDAVLANMARAA